MDGKRVGGRHHCNHRHHLMNFSKHAKPLITQNVECQAAQAGKALSKPCRTLWLVVATCFPHCTGVGGAPFTSWRCSLGQHADLGDQRHSCCHQHNSQNLLRFHTLGCRPISYSPKPRLACDPPPGPLWMRAPRPSRPRKRQTAASLRILRLWISEGSTQASESQCQGVEFSRQQSISPEVLSRRVLAGTIVVGRLGARVRGQNRGPRAPPLCGGQALLNVAVPVAQRPQQHHLGGGRRYGQFS